jgi:hypothetical protein
MIKLLVKNTDGIQELLEVYEGGEYFDESAIIWNTEKDGELPPITIGGMRREGDSLIFDQNVMDLDLANRAKLQVVAKNAEIIKQLAIIDVKSIRPLRDGDTEIVNSLREQAAALRQQLIKD